MMERPSARMADYHYELPEASIARFPLPQRDASRLLLFHEGRISHHVFSQLPGLLPENTLLLFNDTKVIPARLRMPRATGAMIELFLLHPTAPTPELTAAMQVQGQCRWQCLIGNRKRWKPGELLALSFPRGHGNLTLYATQVADDEVAFSWNGDLTFLEVIQAAGQLPLPPYLNREAEAIDYQTYQTVFSRNEGAVAAPTAGLHFTEKTFADLRHQHIRTATVTLHVGAGTFLPVKAADIADHTMHREQLVATTTLLQTLLAHQGPVVAVGTTSLRAVESLYWWGAGLLQGEQPGCIRQFAPYETAGLSLPTRQAAFSALLAWLEATGQMQATGETQLLIMPGYRLRVAAGLLTNFHQPGSTLLLLVAALTGPRWREVYAEAIQQGYRFLSYGDASLLLSDQLS